MDYTKKLMIKASELYYNQNINQQQIANKLNISRVKVSRLLTGAKNKGIVKIEIAHSEDNCIDLEKELERKYGIGEAVVISAEDKSRDLIFLETTSIAAQLIEEKITKDDILGVAWGRTLKKVSEMFDEVNKGVKIVQLLGNVGSSDESGDVIIRRIASSLSGEIYLLSTPAVVDNIKIKDAIMSDRNISKIFNMQRKCSMAIVGIGEVGEKSTLVQSGYLSKQEVNQLRKDGAVGEVCGKFVNSQGQLCNFPVNSRVLGIEIEDLKDIPYVVAVATGEEKVQSINAVLNTGAIDVLITDEKTIKNLLI